MTVFNPDKFFKQKIDTLHSENRYRVFTNLERFQSSPPFAAFHPGPLHPDQEVREVSVWCTNDYLGLSHHPEMIKAQTKATLDYGVSSGGTRNIAGSAYLHYQLEEDLAVLHNKEKALLFSSGYVANEATLTTLGDHIPDLVFLSDEKVHASMIQGMRHSCAARQIFRHNDMSDLENHLKQLPLTQPKMIVFVSVYSMDGDIAPIQQICELAQRYNAMTYLDEVHAVGIYGPNGAGVAAMTGFSDKITIIQGNFAKGFGSYGGYIASNQLLVDFVRSYASGFIFTTSLPPAVVAASKKAIEIMRCDKILQTLFHERVTYLKKCLSSANVPYNQNNSHIISVVVGEAGLCKKLCENLLFNHNMYVQPINYPTVPRGSERLRITVTPHHSFELIEKFANALSLEWANLKIQKAA